MSSKNALKKLKKKTVKVTSKSLKQLNALTSNTSKVIQLEPRLKQELNQLSEQVIGDMISEFIPPLNPIISWFNGDGQRRSYTPKDTSPSTNQLTAKVQNKAPQSFRPKMANSQPISIVQIPLKSPPCKRCPALASGNCKCAAKKFNINL